MSTFTSARGLFAQLIAGFALLALLIGMVPTQAFAVANNGGGVGNPDAECQAKGFDFGITKFDWTNGAYVETSDTGFPKPGYSVEITGDTQSVNWNSDLVVAGVLVKAGQLYSQFTGGLSGTVNNDGVEDKDISHVTFCGKNPTTGTIIVDKVVVGSDTVTDADFNLFVGAETVVDEVGEEFAPATYVVTETPKDGIDTSYTTTFSGDCDAAGNITAELGKTKTCTITNTYEAPARCVIGSSLSTAADSGDTYLRTKHPNWTQQLAENIGSWIWSTPDEDGVVTFTHLFYVDENPDSASITIGADNTYSGATLNGTPLTCDGSGNGNYVPNGGDTCSAPVQQGLNTLVVTVTNEGGPDSGNLSNPAGFIFEVAVEGSECRTVEAGNLGSITIEKEVVGEKADWSFDFTGALGAFALTEDANSKTFNNLVAGEYLVNEMIPEGWDAPQVTCTDTNSGAGQGDDQLVVALAAGENVTCTFTNTVPVPPICPMGPNLLSNGSFEDPAIGSQWTISAIADWVITKVSDGTPTLGEIWRGLGVGPSEGLQNVELGANERTELAQVVATIPGATYELRYDFAARGTNAADNSLDVQVNDSTVRNVTSGNTAWTTYTDSFVATGASTEIAFRDVGTPNSTGTLLDNAVLCQTAAAPTFTIGGTKYSDEDQSGNFTEGETPIEGWTFALYYGESSTPVATTVTDEYGEYEFVIPFDPEKSWENYWVDEVIPEGSDWVKTGMLLNGEEARVCVLPTIEIIEGDLAAARSTEGEGSRSIDCDFFNYSDEGETEVPRCELTASDTNIRRGQEITLSWDIVGKFYSAMLTNNQNDDDYEVDYDEPTGSREADDIRRDTTFTLTMFGWGEGEELVEIASCEVFVDVRSSGGGGTRVTRDGSVAGDSTTRPEGQVLGDQVSVVPMGAADAGAGGAAPVEIPALGLATAALVARRK